MVYDNINCFTSISLFFLIFQNEGTTLLLADIFCTCFGWEPIKPVRDTTLNGGTRIDPKFVNNPELSDVQFLVEGRVFYAHKIVLVTSSPRFRGMLSSRLCEGNPPVVQINDIRYHIFQVRTHSKVKLHNVSLQYLTFIKIILFFLLHVSLSCSFCTMVGVKTCKLIVVMYWSSWQQLISSS